MKATSPASVTDIINAIQVYNDSFSGAKWLVHPTTTLFSDTFTSDTADEVITQYSSLCLANNACPAPGLCTRNLESSQ